MLPIVQRKVSDPDLKEILNRLVNNANLLKNEIDKILEAAQTKAFGTAVELKDCSLNDIVQPIVDKYKQVFSEKEIIVSNEISTDIFVKADSFQLVKVFDQLLSNSSKHSSNGSNITIFAEDSGDSIRVEFEDTGSGLEKDVLEHVFDEFYKEDSSRHDLSSSGLGLHICKNIIELLGGNIRVHSLGADKGLTFYMTLKKGVKNKLF